MAIYGRFGHKLTIERKATLEDIKPLTGRKPDKQDREALKHGSYWVGKYIDDGKEDLHHLGFLKADGGAAEVSARLREIDPEGGW